MATAPRTKDNRVRFLDEAAWREQLDKQARRTLGISGDEFIARYKAGQYRDPDDDPNVMWLVMLLPENW